MKTKTLTALLLLAALCLTACGKKGDLEPPDKNKFTAAAFFANLGK